MTSKQINDIEQLCTCAKIFGYTRERTAISMFHFADKYGWDKEEVVKIMDRYKFKGD